jgi:hypothetical protein
VRRGQRNDVVAASTQVSSRAAATAGVRRPRQVIGRLESVDASPALLWFVVLLGVIPRIWLYATKPSLWLDESFLALNVIRRSMSGLLEHPLDFNQTAPPGFLFLEKLGTDVADKGEYTLRALPLLSGVVSVLLCALLARRVAGAAAAVVATALVAFAGPLIYYSSELKPYAGDIAAGLAISLMGVAMLNGRLSSRRVLGFGLLGFALIQITYAGILAAAGTAAAVLAIFIAARAWDRALPAFEVAVVWAAGAVVFLIAHNGVEHGQFMQGKYGRFAPLPSNRAALTWYADRAKEFANDANLYHGAKSPLVVVTLLAIGLALLGALNLLRRRPRLFAVLVAPVIVTLAASLAHRYPLLERTMVFFVPLLFVFVARGIVVMAAALPRTLGTLAAAAAAGVLVIHVAFAGPYNAMHPPAARPDIKGSLSYVARHWRPGDVLYVQYGSQYAFAYYEECDCFRLPGNREPASLWAVRPVRVLNPSAQFPRALEPETASVFIGARRPVHTERPSNAYRHDAALLEHHPRAWVLVTWYFGPQELALINGELLHNLGRHGRRVVARHRDAAYVYLYDFSHG